MRRTHKPVVFWCSTSSLLFAFYVFTDSSFIFCFVRLKKCVCWCWRVWPASVWLCLVDLKHSLFVYALRLRRADMIALAVLVNLVYRWRWCDGSHITSAGRPLVRIDCIDRTRKQVYEAIFWTNSSGRRNRNNFISRSAHVRRSTFLTDYHFVAASIFGPS